MKQVFVILCFQEELPFLQEAGVSFEKTEEQVFREYVQIRVEINNSSALLQFGSAMKACGRREGIEFCQPLKKAA